MFMFPPLGIGRNFFVVRGWKLEGRAFPPLGIRRGDFFVGRGEFDKGDVSPLGIWGDFLWAGGGEVHLYTMTKIKNDKIVIRYV